MGQFIDLTGKRFGRLTVLHIGTRTKDYRITWRCRCDCGNIVDVMRQSLIAGTTKSCGCYNTEVKHSKYIDMSGMRFGRLTVNNEGIKRPSGNNRGVVWLCKCDCGNEVWVNGIDLRQGNTRSCGCLHVDQLKNIDRTKISHAKHGGIDKHGNAERLYSVWKGMKNRCYCKNLDVYKYYGKRGIEVCAEWKNDYAAFRKWALENGYDENAPHGKCTIDRIDNNGNYEPNNCRFVSMAVQNMNKRPKGTCEPCGRWD